MWISPFSNFSSSITAFQPLVQHKSHRLWPKRASECLRAHSQLHEYLGFDRETASCRERSEISDHREGDAILSSHQSLPFVQEQCSPFIQASYIPGIMISFIFQWHQDLLVTQPRDILPGIAGPGPRQASKLISQHGMPELMTRSTFRTSCDFILLLLIIMYTYKAASDS